MWVKLDTPQSVGLLWLSDRPDAETSTWQQTTREFWCRLTHKTNQQQLKSDRKGIHLENQRVPLLVKKFPKFLEAGGLLRCLQEPQLSNIFSPIIQGHAVRHSFFNIHFSAVFYGRVVQMVPFLQFSPPKPCIHFFPPHSCHIFHQYNPLEFHDPNKIWWWAQTLMFFIMKFSLFILRPNIFPNGRGRLERPLKRLLDEAEAGLSEA